MHDDNTIINSKNIDKVNIENGNLNDHKDIKKTEQKVSKKEKKDTEKKDTEKKGKGRPAKNNTVPSETKINLETSANNHESNKPQSVDLIESSKPKKKNNDYELNIESINLDDDEKIVNNTILGGLDSFINN